MTWSTTIKNKAENGFWLVEKYGVAADSFGEQDFYAVTEIHADPTTGKTHNDKKFTSFLTIGEPNDKKGKNL